MDRQLALVEHQPAVLAAVDTRLVAEAIADISATLRPRLAQVARSGQQIEVRNLVGTARLDDRTVLEVRPKVPAGEDWTAAIVQLLEEDTRIHITGSQRSSPTTRRDDLTTAIAHEYARRLERALAKDGPIQIFERRRHLVRRPNGHLDVSRYLRTALLDPTVYPVDRNEFTVNNDFARGLAVVARLFRRAATQPAVRARLQRLETAVLPEQPAPFHTDPTIAGRRLPAQWTAYQPAWDLATAVLRNRSLVGDPGSATGLEVAIEPWPLLETLLVRTLRRLALEPGLGLQVPAKQRYRLLTDPPGWRRQPATRASVEPDGVLRRGTTVAASFEAKYTDPGEVPDEAHIYQALAAAAALHAPLAVIVYPGLQMLRHYDVHGFSDGPLQLATVGLDLYGYRRSDGDQRRADLLRTLVAEVPRL